MNRGHDQRYSRPGHSNWRSGTHAHPQSRGPGYRGSRSRSPSYALRGHDPSGSPRTRYSQSPNDSRPRVERERRPYEHESRPRSRSDAEPVRESSFGYRGTWRRGFGKNYNQDRDYEDRYERRYSSGALVGTRPYDLGRSRGRGRGRGRGGWPTRTHSRSQTRSRSPPVMRKSEDRQGKGKEKETVDEALPSPTRTLVQGPSASDVEPKQLSSTSPLLRIEDLYAGLSDDGVTNGVPSPNSLPSGSRLPQDDFNGLANKDSGKNDETEDPSRSDDSGEMSVDFLDLTYPSESGIVSGPQPAFGPQLESRSSEPASAVQSSSHPRSESTSLPGPMSATPHKTEENLGPETSIQTVVIERSQSDSQVPSETVMIPMKRERSISPVPSLSMARSLVTTGVKRYAPLPPSCVAGRADFKGARKEWSLRMMKELERLGLRCTKTIIRYEWTLALRRVCSLCLI